MDLRPDAPQAPGLGLYVSEPLRGALQLGVYPFAAPWLARAPRSEPHGVLVLPGFMTTDSSTALLRRFLRGLGHTVWGWRLGRNLGPSRQVLDGMPLAVTKLAERTGGPVSIVGWSLGGIYARELAKRSTSQVRQVVTLGSPFAMTDPRQSRVDRRFRKQAQNHVPQWSPGSRPLRPVPVPSTAIYSKRDGIVHWTTCVDKPSPTHQNIEVRCAHLGFGADPATLWAVADRLAQPADAWQRFRPPGMLRPMYPRVD